MMISRFLIITFAIWSCTTNETTNNVVTTDSFIQTMRSELIEHFKQGRIDNALKYLDSIKPIINKQNNSQITVAWNSYKSNALLAIQNFDSAKNYVNTAMKLAEQSNIAKSRVLAKIHFVNLLIQERALDTALKQALQALELSKSNAPPELPMLYKQLSFLYLSADDSANYRKYLFLGLNISKDSSHIASFSSDIGRYYIQRGQLDSAEYFYSNFQNYNQYKTSYVTARKKADLAFLLLSQNKHEEAISFLKQAIKLNNNDHEPNNWAYLNIGIAYTVLKNYDNALAYLDTAIMLARNQGDLENISNSLFHKSTVLIAEKNFDQAYRLLDSSYIYHLQYDTIAFRNKAAQVEVKLKDNLIDSMATANKAQRKISNQRLVIIITLALSVFLAALIAFLVLKRRKIQLQLKAAELQVKAAELEQQLLRSQIDPHLIFNILAVLQSYIRNGNISRAGDYLGKVSRFLRLSLENARKPFILLMDEIIALECYLALQAEQLDKSFEYAIETYPGAENDQISIPPMIIQPFVENAITHGFAGMIEKGNLKIKFKRFENALRCEVEDNGKGLNGSKREDSHRLKSTTISRKRLSLLGTRTGKPAHFDIQDKKQIGSGSGVLVTIDIPFIENYPDSL